MLGLTGFLGLTRIPQIPQYCFVGGKSHRCFCAWAGSHGFRLFLGSHGSHRSHGILCGWEISQMLLWVGSWGLVPWGCLGLALTDLFFGPFGPFRPIGQIRPISNRTDWTFLKIIREICGICVRPRWTPCGRVTKLQKIVLFGRCFERFEKKVWKKLLH